MKSTSRTINSIRNMIFGVGYQFSTIILSFVNRSIFIYTLGISYLGISGLFSDILTMLSMADMGFGVALTYSMYKPLANHDHKRLAALTTFYGKVYHIIASAVLIIGLLLVPFLKYIVNLKTPIHHLALYYILYVLNTVASYLVIYKTSIIDADQKDYILNKYRGIFNVAQTISTIVLLLITHSFLIYLLVQLFFTYALNFYSSHIAEKNYPYIKEKVELPISDAKEIFQNLYSVFIYKMSIVLMNATDNILISTIVGTVVVGYYSNYNMVTTKVIAVINAVFYAFTSSIGNLIITEKSEKRYKTFIGIQYTSLMLSVFCLLCMGLLLQDFIKVWLGNSFTLSNNVLLAILMNFYLDIIIFPVRTFREATGLYLRIKYVMLIAAMINIALSIIMGKQFGIFGILIATTIAKLTTYFWYEPLLLFKVYFKHSSKVYFRNIILNMLLSFFLFFTTYLIFKKWHCTNWSSFFIKAIVIGIISLCLSIISYRKTQGFAIVKDHIIDFK